MALSKSKLKNEIQTMMESALEGNEIKADDWTDALFGYIVETGVFDPIKKPLGVVGISLDIKGILSPVKDLIGSTLNPIWGKANLFKEQLPILIEGMATIIHLALVPLFLALDLYFIPATPPIFLFKPASVTKPTGLDLEPAFKAGESGAPIPILAEIYATQIHDYFISGKWKITGIEAQWF